MMSTKLAAACNRTEMFLSNSEMSTFQHFPVQMLEMWKNTLENT